MDNVKLRSADALRAQGTHGKLIDLASDFGDLSFRNIHLFISRKLVVLSTNLRQIVPLLFFLVKKKLRLS